MLCLKDKSILFIAPQFYGYEKIISDQLKKKGALVYYYPERLNSFRYKFINNFMTNSLSDLQASYYSKIITQIRDKEIDYLFVIRGFLMPVDFVKKLRLIYPKLITILHQWDSILNYNYTYLIGLFDYTFSFDPMDCEKYPSMKYLPNFYLPEYLNLLEINQPPIYDISFVGWGYCERTKIIEKLHRQLSQKSFYIYCYLPFTRYLLNKLKGKKLVDIKTKSLPLSEIHNIVAKSRFILDLPDPKQSGYTFRLIDALAAGKKIITTNYFIKNEELFHPNNILLIDMHDPIIDTSFFDRPFVPLNTEDYSIDNWLKKIFEGNHK